MAVIIENNKILLREFEKEDAIVFAKMASDGSLNEIFGDSDDYSKWMSDWVNETQQLYIENNPLKEYLAYVIVDKSLGAVVGAVGCSAYEQWNEVGITYFIDSKFRRKGFASLAVKLYLDYFANSYEIEKIIATVKLKNTASLKVIEKVGFIFDKCELFQDCNDESPEKYNFYHYQM